MGEEGKRGKEGRGGERYFWKYMYYIYIYNIIHDNINI